MDWIQQYISVLVSYALYAEANGLHYVSTMVYLCFEFSQIQAFEQAIADYPLGSPGLTLASRSLQMLLKQF